MTDLDVTKAVYNKFGNAMTYLGCVNGQHSLGRCGQDGLWQLYQYYDLSKAVIDGFHNVKPASASSVIDEANTKSKPFKTDLTKPLMRNKPNGLDAILLSDGLPGKNGPYVFAYQFVSLYGNVLWDVISCTPDEVDTFVKNKHEPVEYRWMYSDGTITRMGFHDKTTLMKYMKSMHQVTALKGQIITVNKEQV